jgi:hypothetical protein
MLALSALRLLTRGNGIEALAAERLAAQDAPEREQAAFAGAVTFDGFNGVMGAAGVETAIGAKPRGYAPLVKADQENT